MKKKAIPIIQEMVSVVRTIRGWFVMLQSGIINQSRLADENGERDLRTARYF